MKAHSFFTLTGILLLKSAVAQGQVILNPVNPNFAVIAGIDIRTQAHSPHMHVTLHVLKGNNECEAQTTELNTQVQSLAGSDIKSLSVSRKRIADVMCPAIYDPRYQDVQIMVHSSPDSPLMVQTNNEVMGRVFLFANQNQTVIRSFEKEPLQNLAGKSSWKVLKAKINAMKGSNSCVAALSDLKGFVYTWNGELRVAASSEWVREMFCPRHYQPVFADIEVVGAFKAPAVKKIVVENFEEIGNFKSVPF
jgi:hypothetical protein